MLVLSELGFALLCGHHPDAHRLVVGAAGDQGAVLVGPHHAHPLSVPRESLHAVTVQKDTAELKRWPKTLCTCPGNARTLSLLSVVEIKYFSAHMFILADDGARHKELMERMLT